MGKEDGRRERIFCSGAICGPWYQLLQNNERIRGGHKCCDDFELLIYSSDSDSTAGWDGG